MEVSVLVCVLRVTHCVGKVVFGQVSRFTRSSSLFHVLYLPPLPHSSPSLSLLFVAPSLLSLPPASLSTSLPTQPYLPFSTFQFNLRINTNSHEFNLILMPDLPYLTMIQEAARIGHSIPRGSFATLVEFITNFRARILNLGVGEMFACPGGWTTDQVRT